MVERRLHKTNKACTMAVANTTPISISPQIQISLFTKNEKYSIPDSPFSIPGTSTKKELNLLANSILESTHEDWQAVEFDFIVATELLCLSLQQHLEEKEINTENVIEIEFLERYPAPTPEDSLLHDDWVSAVKSCDKWILSGCYDNTLHLWSNKGEHKMTIPSHIAPVKSVTWVTIGDPLCSFISTSHDETAMLWQWNHVSNAIEGVSVCKGHTRSVDCVDCAPYQGKFVTGSYDRTIKLWSSIVDDDNDTSSVDEQPEQMQRKKFKSDNGKTKYRNCIVTLTGHTEAVSGVQWTDTNEILSVSLDHTVRLWDLELAGLKSQLNGSKSIFDVSYSELSRNIITASADRHVRLWDPRTKEGNVVKSSFTSHNAWVSCVKWSPTQENHFVSGSYDKVFKLWDTRSPRAPLYDMSGHDDRILCCDWGDSNYIVSGGADNHMKLYKTKNLQNNEMDTT